MKPTQPPPRFTPSGFQPTSEQLEIQMSRDKTVLIEANAGAAKTTTLALRAGESLARGLAPNEILILVFTSEARDVMRKRLIEIGIPASVASQIQVNTFDDFSEGVLYAFDGYEPKSIRSQNELKPYVIAAIEHVSTRYEGKFDCLELATHNIAISQFIDAQLSMKAKMSPHQDFDGMDTEDIAYTVGVTLTHWLTFQEYERLRYGAFDEVEFLAEFDATYDLARRLIDSPELQAALPAYRLLLCDELHDLNEAAFRILMALLSDGKTSFVGAGDKDQVIHATLGADAQYLHHRFDGCGLGHVARLPLTATYRYGPHLALTVGKLKQKQSTSPLARTTKIEQRYYQAGNDDECAQLVVNAITDWRKSQQGGRCAILIRERHQSILIENALMQAGIGYESLRMEKYLQRGEILFLRGMIAIALKNLISVKSPEVRMAIIEALVTYGELTLDYDPELDGSVPHNITKSVSDALEYAKIVLNETPDMLNDFFKGQILRSESRVRNRMTDVVKFVESLPEDTTADDALREICRLMNVESLVKRIHVYPYEASVVLRSIEGFIRFAATSGKSIKEFSEWIGEAESHPLGKKGNSVVLECVANSKGMEFDHVILPFLEVGQFPDPSAEFKQEENLFYVGITRAKSALTLITPKVPAKQSPFVGRMAIDDIESEATMAIANAEPVSCRTDLQVPFHSKDEAKALGAKWDGVRKVWYVDAGIDIHPFKRWIK
ncbi:MAG: ATP-dependent helicase [Gallionella sp.]